MTVEEFLDNLGSSLWDSTTESFGTFLEGLIEAPVTYGGGTVCTTTAMKLGYNPIETSTGAAEIVGGWTSSMDERTITGLGITTTGGATYGTTVDPGEIGGIYNRDGKKIGSIRKESRANISRVERNAEKVYSNFHKDLMKTSTPIIMADDPATYDAMDAFLKARSSGMLLRTLNVLDTVLSNDEDDALSQ